MTDQPVAPTQPANQVTARYRRTGAFAMLAELLPGVTARFESAPAKRWLTVTFDRDLTADEAADVVAHLESTDADDLDARAALRQLTTSIEARAAEDPTPERAALLLLIARDLDA